MTAPADVNVALIAYLGYKRADSPQSDWQAVVDGIGMARAEAVEIPMLVILSELHEMKPDWTIHSLWSGSEWAVRELRKRHPELEESVVKPLVWAFSYGHK